MTDMDWPQSIECTDVSGRPRSLLVYISAEARVVVQTPPGDVGLVAPGEVTEFKRILTAAQVEALQRRQLG